MSHERRAPCARSVCVTCTRSWHARDARTRVTCARGARASLRCTLAVRTLGPSMHPPVHPPRARPTRTAPVGSCGAYAVHTAAPSPRPDLSACATGSVGGLGPARAQRLKVYPLCVCHVRARPELAVDHRLLVDLCYIRGPPAALLHGRSAAVAEDIPHVRGAPNPPTLTPEATRVEPRRRRHGFHYPA
eukprot:6200283-Pleurochrysis_carterae.AAC.1